MEKNSEQKVRVLPKYKYLPIPFLLAGLVLWKGTGSWFELLWYGTAAVFAYVAAVVDYETRRIPNALIGYMFAAWVFILAPQFLVNIEFALKWGIHAIFGFLLAAIVFAVVYVFSKGGLGGGDVKYMAVMGLFMGYDGILFATLVGTVLTSVVGLALILMKRMTRKDPLPLAPFLFIGIVVTIAII